MQGVIVTPSGDVWALGLTKGQLVHFPKGDLARGRIVCEGRKDAEPCKSFIGPFFLGIDQQDRIWVTNGFGAHVTRFPASDPTKVEKFSTGYSGSGLAIDSQGNVWVTNRLGNTLRGGFDVVEDIIVMKTGRQRRRIPHRADVAAEQLGRWKRHATAARRLPVPGLPVHRPQPLRSVGRRRGRGRQRLDLELRHSRRAPSRTSAASGPRTALPA